MNYKLLVQCNQLAFKKNNKKTNLPGKQNSTAYPKFTTNDIDIHVLPLIPHFHDTDLTHKQQIKFLQLISVVS